MHIKIDAPKKLKRFIIWNRGSMCLTMSWTLLAENILIGITLYYFLFSKIDVQKKSKRLII